MSLARHRKKITCLGEVEEMHDNTLQIGKNAVQKVISYYLCLPGDKKREVVVREIYWLQFRKGSHQTVWGADEATITGALEEVRHSVIRNGLTKEVPSPSHLFPGVSNYAHDESAPEPLPTLWETCQQCFNSCVSDRLLPGCSSCLVCSEIS